MNTAPEPFTAPCAGCGQPRTTTMPCIKMGTRGLTAEPCPCGEPRPPWCVILKETKR